MTVNNIPLTPGVRDSYWRDTQAELHSIHRRGDYLLLALVLAMVVGVILAREWLGDGALWMFIAGAAFISLFVAEVLYVAACKRRIAAARGLACGKCSYMPHDTEINDVASTRRCPRCAGEL